MEDAAEKTKDYAENVLDRIVGKYEIADKIKFIAFAQDYDANNNDYLTEAELKKAAIDYTKESNKSDAEVEEIQEAPQTEEDVDSEEGNVDSAGDSSDESTDDEEEETDLEESDSEGVIEEVITDSAMDNLAKLVSTAAGLDMTIRSMFETIDTDEDGMINGPELQLSLIHI